MSSGQGSVVAGSGWGRAGDQSHLHMLCKPESSKCRTMYQTRSLLPVVM